MEVEVDYLSCSAQVIEGRQEDAEEFLTCLLNMISDEMVSLLKVEETQPPASVPAGRRDSEEGVEWQEVGSRGKSCITRRIKDQSNIVTPVQQLALGLCRYSVKSANSETSATLQPFYTLQLDIQSDNITRLVWHLSPPSSYFTLFPVLTTL